MTLKIRLSSGDVCGMLSRETIHSSWNAYLYKENSLQNISRKDSGNLRSQCKENYPITFRKKSIHYLKLDLLLSVLWGQQHVCYVCSSLCFCVWQFSMYWKKAKFFQRFPHSRITCVFLKSTQESGGLTCQQFTITVPSAQRFNKSSPWMNHKWITVFKDKEITGTYLFRGRGSTVTCQLQKRFNLFSVFLWKDLYGHTHQTMKHMVTWLSGPHEQRHTWKTHKPTYVTLPMAFCVTVWIIHAPWAEGIHHYT